MSEGKFTMAHAVCVVIVALALVGCAKVDMIDYGSDCEYHDCWE